MGRAPAFEQLQLQRPGLAAAHQQPQRCGRGLVAAALEPKNKDQAFKLLGTDLQAAYLLGLHLGQPGEHGRCGIGLEQLLQRPELVLRAAAVDPHQLRRCQAALGQPTGMGRQWWGQRDDGFVRLALAQGHAGQTPFQGASLGLQHLGQTLAGPAFARQLGIERIPAGGGAGHRRAHQVVTAPELGGDRGRQGQGIEFMHGK